jgi:hypothetical protein
VAITSLAALPFALHYGWTIEYASTYGANHPDQPVGIYPELQMFRLLVPAAVIIWVGAAIFLIRKLPIAAALSPVPFFALYWFVGLKNITGAEGGVRLDNAASIVLFLFCVGVAAFALSFSLSAMGAARSLGRLAGLDRDQDH